MNPFEFTLNSITPDQIEKLEKLVVDKGLEIKDPYRSTGRADTLIETLGDDLPRRFEVHCEPMIKFEELHPLDQTEGPPSIYECENAQNEEEALDDFHGCNPIKVLDNYEIETVCIYKLPK